MWPSPGADVAEFQAGVTVRTGRERRRVRAGDRRRAGGGRDRYGRHVRGGDCGGRGSLLRRLRCQRRGQFFGGRSLAPRKPAVRALVGTSARLCSRLYECMYASRALSPSAADGRPVQACPAAPPRRAALHGGCASPAMLGGVRRHKCPWMARAPPAWMGWNGMGWEAVRRLAIRRTAARRASHARASTAGTRTAAPPAHASRPARRRRRRTPTGPPPPRPMARARRRSGRPSRGRRAGAPRTFWNEAALGALRLGDCGWITRRGVKDFGRFGAHI